MDQVLSEITTQTQATRNIQLTQGQEAIVDENLYEELSKYKWYAVYSKHTKSFYAARHEPMVNGNRPFIVMHRQILGLKPGDKKHSDHLNHNTLDNRTANLRIASFSENMRNRVVQRNNTSGFKGVVFIKRENKWLAQIKVDGKQLRLGTRPSAKQAYHDLYVPAAIKYHGEFACAPQA